jgi:hypothetical protein
MPIARAILASDLHIPVNLVAGLRFAGFSMPQMQFPANQLGRF